MLVLGETQYEFIKGHYMAFPSQSPHKRGSSCSNFCKLACLRRRVLDSRLDYELQLANENKQLSESQVQKMIDVGIIDKEVKE